jgi:uncharacterized protein (DUF2336 family)
MSNDPMTVLVGTAVQPQFELLAEFVSPPPTGTAQLRMVEATNKLWGELEWAVQWGSDEKRVEMLRRVTDLLLKSSNRLTDEQIEVFDEVLTFLINVIESKLLVDISRRLGPIKNAPLRTVRQLARDNEIEVAAPILSQSPRLSVADLVELAQNKGQDHLVAICERRNLVELVTDVLVGRGNETVMHKVVANLTASFSQEGFERLIEASKTDAGLMAKTGSRVDLPQRLLRDLFLNASPGRRALLLGVAPTLARNNLRQVLYPSSETDRVPKRNFTQAQQTVDRLRKTKALTEEELLHFAQSGKFEEATAALAALCSAPLDIIKPLMVSPRDDGLLLACKAADLKWETTEAILCLKAPVQGQLQLTVKADYTRLSKTKAQQILQFWLQRNKLAAVP